MPSSSARRIAAVLSRSSVEPHSPPNCQVPKQMRDTRSPLRPRVTWSMRGSYEERLAEQAGVGEQAAQGVGQRGAELLGADLDGALVVVAVPAAGPRHPELGLRQ